MSAAQVSIELVLAGILALCAFVLPFLTGSDISKDLFQDNIWVGVLGIAYLLGVVFDKLADTILTPFENLLRLRQADKYLTKHPNFKGDPFPQNNLEFKLRKDKDGRLEWMDSLKSRIRTSRELAVLGLPATTGIVIYLGLVKTQQVNPIHWQYLFVILNLLFFFAAIWMETRSSDEDAVSRSAGGKLQTESLDKDRKKRNEQLTQARRQMHSNLMVYYFMTINSIIAVVVVALQNPGNYMIGVIGIGGLVVTLLALWACLRITRTYLKFVARAMDEFVAKERREK